MTDCHVCTCPITPNAQGRVRWEGITEAPKAMAWVWGPVPVHEDCRLRLTTPHDDRIGVDYVATGQLIAP